MKNQTNFLKIMAIGLLSLAACKKNDDSSQIATPVQPVANPISDTGCLSGSIKGTMLAGKTYNVCGDIIINEGDTLFMQEGVTVNMTGNYGIGVKGSLVCLGTKAKPNRFTMLSVTKTDVLGADPTTDPAYAGKWIGIIGATTCKLMVLKWTHVEFGGGAIAATSPIKAIYTSPYPLFFQNPYGVFVLEDSWVYGSVDDAIRTYGGKLSIMRNTFEKIGYTGGEALNSKAGTIGDFAYNLCIGVATNGPKLSNSGVIVGVPASNMNFYNNTIVNCGFRRAAAGRGGCVNFEENAGGKAYNNLVVNCKFGLRVVGNPIADTANLRYGYTFYYADTLSVANNFIPSTSVSTAISAAQETDIPKPSTYLPSGWKVGDVYTAPTSLLGANNPKFVNGPTPMPASLNLRDISFVGAYNFKLQSTSPCINAAYKGFSPRADVPVHPKYGATEITAPGSDIGAFQANGTGNQQY